VNSKEKKKRRMRIKREKKERHDTFIVHQHTRSAVAVPFFIGRECQACQLENSDMHFLVDGITEEALS
jgi:hypothetical protein